MNPAATPEPQLPGELCEPALDAAATGICISGKISGKIVYANQKLASLLGKTKDLLTGTTLENSGLIHPEQLREYAEKSTQNKDLIFSCQTAVEIEGVTHSYILVKIRSFNYNNTEYLVSSAIRLTAFAEYQANRENLFRSLLDLMMEGVQIIDHNWRYLYVNESVSSHGKYNKKELEGSTMMEKYPGIEQSELFSKLKDCMENRKSLQMENRFIYPDGSEGWFQLSIQPIPEGLFILSIDISPLKKAQNELKEINESLERTINFRTKELEETNRELESFSYSVSHDLRAPLRAINGFARMLEEDYAPSMDKEANRLLTVIQQNASRMGMLIDDLLNLSRTSRKSLSKSIVKTRELVGHILHELKIPQKYSISVHKLDEIYADASLLRQVFINLLSNAVKYSSQRENPVISISSEKKTGETVFCISDNGVGFDMNYQHKLFSVFQRLHKNTDFEGTGVGLAIVKRIISKHGGQTWAVSEEGKGARFYFSLPHQVPDQNEIL